MFIEKEDLAQTIHFLENILSMQFQCPDLRA